ncbi:MAG TPA: response regulator [Saprospiraceae bacterium]|nr:response regulator [Saprospiraceae bacterium]
MIDEKIHILIVEDEQLAAGRLMQMITKELPLATLDHCASIKETVSYLSKSPLPQLLFMDIRLGDGLCFEIFNQVQVTSPIIFTTAYDDYAIKAFKYNSIDYLLKPIDLSELHEALVKFQTQASAHVSLDFSKLTQLILNAGSAKYYFSKQGENYHCKRIRCGIFLYRKWLYTLSIGQWGKTHHRGDPR